jgi:hypothetical protein
VRVAFGERLSQRMLAPAVPLWQSPALMIGKTATLLLFCAIVTLAARQFIIYWGWQPIHAREFPTNDCAHYHVMRGLEQDPAADPANAGLLQKCGPDYVPWSLSQTGDLLRFDRPARIRLRFDPIDMQRYSNYPPMLVEFPYPPVHLPETFRVRDWGSATAVASARSAAQLRYAWSPSWAGLFAEWSLGRGTHEVWLGGATIEDPAYCEEVEHDAQRNEDFCRMTMRRLASGEPIEIKLPLRRRMEIRLEMLEICRFGGQQRQWGDSFLARFFGPVEYTDRGCAAF